MALVDFGFRTEKVAVGNFVFMDNNDNGLYDAGDMGISSVTVELYLSTQTPGVSTPVATDVTDPSGYYYFDELDAGSYILYIPGSNFGSSAALANKESVPGADTGETTDNNDNGQDTPVNGGIRSNTFTLSPYSEPNDESGAGGNGTGTPSYAGTLPDANVNETLDFGFRLERVALGNYVFMDNNDNGVNDTGDMGVANVTVQLYAAGADYGVNTPLATTTTSATGYYFFDNLAPGTYVVYIPSSNFGSGGSLENKESAPGSDSGDTTDNNDNGQDTPDSGGIASNEITLTPGSEPTGENQTGYTGSLGDDNVNGTVDFGFRLERVALGNFVFMDNNDDGLFSIANGDMGIGGVTVQLYASGANYGVDAPLAVTTTNAAGYYYFDELAPGAYVVYIPASNFNAGQPLRNKASVPGSDSGSSTDNNDNGQDTPVNGGIVSNVITLTPGSEPTGENATDYPGSLDDNNVNATVDFGFRTEKVAVGNFVFMDNNDNGLYDAGDMGISSVTVELYLSTQTPGVSTPVATDVTDPSGYYYFDELDAGSYILYIPGSNFGSSAALANKESVPGADTGETTDNNDNGQDTPVNGGIRSNTFTLSPYSEPNDESGAGGNGTGTPSYAGTLPDANVNETLDFGFRLERVALGNYVFMDNNDNGVNDAGDMGVANVTVELYAAGADYGVNTPLATTTTSATGYYFFDNLAPGTYVVYIPSSNFGSGGSLENKESAPGSDSGDTTDNNDNGQDTPDSGGIASNEITLTPGSEPTGENQTGYTGSLGDDNVNGTVDFGFRLERVALGNFVFMDNNDDGLFSIANGDMGIGGVTVQLYASGANYGVDAPLAVTTTNAAGYYYFDELAPGAYVVYIPASNFNAGQPLRNKASVPGSDSGSSTDNNDNGQDTPVNGGIVSNVITLTPGSEPTGENATDYPGSLDDNNVNATVDFRLPDGKSGCGQLCVHG
jgi:hypothetical protein